jgi:tRNA pseudouridine38-40 synthase
MKNFKMVLEYDGSGYHGWQRQARGMTIQEAIETAIRQMTGERATLIGSGRTDAGVHALHQVANFRSQTYLSAGVLLRGLNSLLPGDIAVRELQEADESFHAQFDARSKVYEYRIFNNEVRSALMRNYVWFIHVPLDIGAMREAAEYLTGKHDFSCFCASGHESASFVREVFRCGFETDGQGMYVFSIEADGFLKYMVRNIIGTLVDVGKGKRPPAAVRQVMRAKDRRQAGVTAPAHGLYLKDVKY